MRNQQGNAAVEFVAVVPLLFLIGIAVLQVALFAHAKSLVDMAAVEAARAAAVSADPSAAARAVAEKLLAGTMGGVPLEKVSLQRGSVSGVPVITVEVRARPQLALLPVQPVLTGRGRALVEGSL